jgi:hypothetical protein
MSDTTADIILNHLHDLRHPAPTAAIITAHPDLNPETIRTTLKRMGRDGRLIPIHLFGGTTTYWTPTKQPGDGTCRHPITLRNDVGHQCAHCGRQVTVR